MTRLTLAWLRRHEASPTMLTRLLTYGLTLLKEGG